MMTTTARSPESIRRHYEVEKSLADRLRHSASREERARIYQTMYDELFAAVPDHPRLTRVHDAALVASLNRSRLRILGRDLRADARVLDIGAGDGTFAKELASRARAVYALDISEGSVAVETLPDNVTIVLYDGFAIPFTPGSLDLAFSDQLVEHLHLDDQHLHFQNIAMALAPGGAYIIRTPHRFSGPHDVSTYYTNGDAQGFPMKEWTYHELQRELLSAGFSRVEAVWAPRSCAVRVPVDVMTSIETLLKPLPVSIRRTVSRIPFPSLTIAARTAR
jgi:SAM-dependent methyltransferase